MRIYTRSVDKGKTALVYGKRVAKNDARVEAYGTCDEANSMIGMALSFLHDVEWDKKEDFLEKLYRVQTVLFHVGAELSTPSDREVAWKLKDSHITELEEQIDECSEALPALTLFILLSVHSESSSLHLERKIVRRSVSIAVVVQDEIGDIIAISYLTRFSVYQSVAARYVNIEFVG